MEDNEEKEHVVCTPPDLINAAKDASDSLIPAKSRDRYERTYREFEDWRNKEQATSYSERTILAYLKFMVEHKKSKPTSLWAYYSMIKTMLKLNQKIDIGTYAQVTAFLKRQGEGYEPVKARVFEEEEMKKFILEAPDNEWLVVKVCIVFRNTN